MRNINRGSTENNVMDTRFILKPAASISQALPSFLGYTGVLLAESTVSVLGIMKSYVQYRSNRSSGGQPNSLKSL